MSDDIISIGPMPDTESIKQMSPITLAFVGDAVFSLLVREYLICSGITKAGILHKEAVNFVKAGAQSASAGRLQPILTQEEKDVLRRGRNANTSRVPKNVNPIDYRIATGLESLFGYLYLGGSHLRLREIFKAIVDDARQDGQADTYTGSI